MCLPKLPFTSKVSIKTKHLTASHAYLCCILELRTMSSFRKLESASQWRPPTARSKASGAPLRMPCALACPPAWPSKTSPREFRRPLQLKRVSPLVRRQNLVLLHNAEMRNEPNPISEHLESILGPPASAERRHARRSLMAGELPPVTRTVKCETNPVPKTDTSVRRRGRARPTQAHPGAQWVGPLTGTAAGKY